MDFLQKMKRENQREANFELLRIISMILIILHHYALYGGVINIKNINGCIGVLIILGGKIGVNLFVLISGYFLIHSKFKIKKLLKLIGQVCFYEIVMLMINLVVDPTVPKEILIGCSIKSIPEMYWFIRSYIIMYVFSPVLNKMVSKLSRETYRLLLICGFFAFGILPYLWYFSIRSYIWFMYVYLIGAYIHIFAVQFKTKIDKILIIWALYILEFYLNLYTWGKYKIFLYGSNFILILMISVLLFIVFKDLKITKHQAIIKKIASLSLAVYLIHENTIFRDVLWQDILRVNYFYNQNVILLIGNIISSIVVIYLMSIILEYIRIYCVERIIQKIYTAMKKKYRAELIK